MFTLEKEAKIAVTFYNRAGRPCGYIDDDGCSIYTFEGQPVAYIYGESVYTYGGEHIGWFRGGWIRDQDGHAVFFVDGATGGPVKPLKELEPLKGLKRLRPLKGLKQLPPLQPLDSLSWSTASTLFLYE